MVTSRLKGRCVLMANVVFGTLSNSCSYSRHGFINLSFIIELFFFSLKSEFQCVI